MTADDHEKKRGCTRVFWGKFDGSACLPLAAHCLDVAMTFRNLSEMPGIQRALESAAHSTLS
jgi:hypothetical protein